MFLEILKYSLTEVKDFFLKQKEKKEKSYEAIETIFIAANETSVFLAECNREIEEPNKVLSNIWINAASKVRELDSDLYNRLLAKSEYWSNPEIWTEEKVKKYNISLESIKKDCRIIIEAK